MLIHRLCSPRRGADGGHPPGAHVQWLWVRRMGCWALGLGAAAALAGAAYAVYALGVRHGSAPVAPAGGVPLAPALQALPQGIAQGEAATRRHLATGLKAGDVDPLVGRKVLYYHDPMVPGNQFEQPGKSPFMDMMLVPVYADSTAISGGAGAEEQGVRVSPRLQHTLGVRTALVVQGTLSAPFSAVGSIAWDERAQVVVSARATALVERLWVRASFERVAPGQPLAELYVPEWGAAQEEFLAQRRLQGSEWAARAEGARARLRQLGMDEAQIALVESTGRAQPRFTLAAPLGGLVTELALREGMVVAQGAALARIQGTATVWAHAEVPESQAARLRTGMVVKVSSPALPGAPFDARVQTLLPEVHPSTRTRKARLELPNPRAALVPGMLVQVQFLDAPAAPRLLVPTEAVIHTGQRTLAVLALEGGGFRPVEVAVGREAGEQTEVLRGLQAGQRVVVSGQFLIDSEASLRGVLARLNEPPPPPAAAVEGSRP